MAMLLYGAGLRLRVKDLDFDANEILVREGKGNKDRVTTLPASVREPLTAETSQATWAQSMSMSSDECTRRPTTACSGRDVDKVPEANRRQRAADAGRSA
jgi:integrase